jgi:hypothetical protein
MFVSTKRYCRLSTIHASCTLFILLSTGPRSYVGDYDRQRTLPASFSEYLTGLCFSATQQTYLSSVFVRCSVLCVCTGQMAQPHLHLPAVDVLQTTGSMKKRCKALDLIRCHYSDFGPTLATENWLNAIIYISLKPSVTG